MRIAYLVTTLGMGGAERVALDVAGRVKKDGHTVRIFVLSGQEPEEWPTELPVEHLGFRRTPWGALGGFVEAWRRVRSFSPEILHSHCFHSNIVARLLRASGVRARVISTIHNVYEGPWTRMLAYRLTDRWADAVVFVCRAAAERFLAKGTVQMRKLRVIRNGIELSGFRPDVERRSRLRSEMGAGEKFIWLSVGRLTAAKDVPNLLRAFAAVRAAHSQAQLWLAGEGEQSYREGLMELSRQLGLVESVRWLGLRRDVAALLDAADGFVLGSAWEGMPLAVAEAMAMERPVVATDVGGVRELTGTHGLLAPAGQADALARWMQSVMEMTEENRKALVEAARARLEGGFTLNACMGAWEHLYASLAGKTDA